MDSFVPVVSNLDLIPNVYCPLCGIILHYESTTSATTSHPWFAEVRGILVDDTNSNEPCLTGVGILSNRNVLSAPLNSRLTYRNAEVLEDITLFQPVGVNWGYGFHNSCWTLLLARLSLTPIDDERRIAKSFTKILHASPCIHFSSFDFGHDYGGASDTHKPFGRSKRIDLLSHFYADPLAIPNLGSLENFTSESSSKPVGNPLHPGFCKGFHKTFGRLSLEVIYEVISYLSFLQIANLRLSCGALASLIQWEYLPQSFWKSRFMLGQSLDFMFPTFFSDLKHNWLRLFYGVQAYMRTGNRSFENRKRVRNILERIAVQIEADITTPKQLYGSSILPDPTTKPRTFRAKKCSSERPTKFQLSGSLSGHIYPSGSRYQPAVHGAHIKHYQAALFPIQVPGHGAEVSVSTVHMLGCHFISGIRYHAKEILQSKAGYVVERHEHSLTLPPGRRLKNIEVAFRISGLVGIRFLFADDSLSQWLGHNGGKGTARGILRIPDEWDVGNWIFGLDEFKIAMIGLAMSNKQMLDAPNRTPNPSAPSLSSPLSYLWTPKFPEHKDLFVDSIQPPRSAAFAVVDVDFGGPNGKYLTSLTRVVLHMMSAEMPIIGMQFFYTNMSFKFGIGGQTELSFIIDGPGGERIDDVEIIVDDPGHHMRGIQLSTNYGRSMRFASMHHHSGSSTNLRQKLPNQYIITGFVATQEENDRHFTGVGLLGQQPQSGFRSQSPVNDDSPLQHPIADQMEYDKQFAYGIRAMGLGEYRTWASLIAVKRIQASIGLPGRSRNSSRISGLKLDYHDQRSSAVVGQWMNACGSFELAPSEEIRGLMIWLIGSGESPEIRGLLQGQISAIRIDTTFDRSMTFQSPDDGSHKGQFKQQQYQAGLNEDLVALSWILNSSYDRIRGVTSTHVSNTPPVYMMPSQPPPYDQVQGIEFKQNSGASEMVSNIEAYFNRGVISGIAFTYPSKRTRKLGDIMTGEYQSIEVITNSRINRFSISIKANAVVELEFQLDLIDERGPIQRVETLRAPSNVTAQYDKRHVWYTCEINGNESTQNMYDRVFMLPPHAELVGLYTSCQDFSRLGALYHNPKP